MLKGDSLLIPLLLVFYEIANYLSNDMYLPALPQMMEDLNLTTQQAQLTLTMWFLGSASMPLFVGVLADHFGRRPVLILGGIIYIIATAICALATNFYELLSIRFIQGAMVPFMLVPGYACIHESYEQKHAIKILALMGSISVLAPAFGPLFGAIVLFLTDWRGIFWVIMIWALIAMILLIKWFPETNPPENRKPFNWASIFKQSLNILTNKKFVLGVLMLGFIFAGFLAWISAGPLLLIENFNFSPLMFGIIQAVIFVIYIIGTYQVKYFIDSLGMMGLIRFGLVITLIGGLFTLALAWAFPQNIYPFLLGVCIYSFGSGLIFSPLNRFIIDASDEPMGIRVALFMMFLTNFAALGSAMASALFNGTLLSLAYLIAAAIIISCVIKVISLIE